MIDIDIHMGDLLRQLNKLPEKMQNRIIKGAVRASAKPIVQEAKRLVPVRTGNLKKSIGVSSRRGSKTVVRVSVSPRRGGKHDGYYGMWIEFGTKKMQPHPFLRPAFERKGADTIKFFKEYLKKRIDKELA